MLQVFGILVKKLRDPFCLFYSILGNVFKVLELQKFEIKGLARIKAHLSIPY